VEAQVGSLYKWGGMEAQVSSLLYRWGDTGEGAGGGTSGGVSGRRHRCTKWL
jgi:hypothetical protein